MIYILSQESGERSTEKVIDWLVAFKAKFKRINGSQYINSFSESISSLEHYASDDSVIWFRRWINDGEVSDRLEDSEITNTNLVNLYKHLSSEIQVLSQILWDKFDRSKWLSHPKELKFNKLEILRRAKKSGLEIPNTLITTSKSELQRFKEENGSIICKMISNAPPRLTSPEYFIGLRTIEINNGIYENIPDNFFPSLFQKMINKRYEIKTFF